MKELYTMSQKEIYRLEVLQKLLTRELSQTKASEVLQISVRQVQRLIRAYNSSGVFGLVSKKRGKPSNNTIPNIIKQYAIRLIKDHYLDFGPTLAAEKLLEKHDLKLSIETVRNLMVQLNHLLKMLYKNIITIDLILTCMASPLHSILTTSLRLLDQSHIV